MYGISLYGSSLQNCYIFIIQKILICNIVAVSHSDSCRPLFHGLHILPLSCLYILETATYMFENKQQYVYNNEICLHVTTCTFHITSTDVCNLRLKIFKFEVVCLLWKT